MKIKYQTKDENGHQYGGSISTVTLNQEQNLDTHQVRKIGRHIITRVSNQGRVYSTRSFTRLNACLVSLKIVKVLHEFDKFSDSQALGFARWVVSQWEQEIFTYQINQFNKYRKIVDLPPMTDLEEKQFSKKLLDESGYVKKDNGIFDYIKSQEIFKEALTTQ